MKSVYAYPVQDNRKIFNKEVLFKLQNFGKVKTVFLELDLACNISTGITSAPVPFGPFVIKEVALESFGMPIARVTTSYTIARIGELSFDISDQLNKAANVNTPLTTVQRVSFPLYFWAFDGNVLDTEKYKNLTIRMTTKDSKEDMGTDRALTTLDARLKVVYQTVGLPMEMDSDKSYNIIRLKESVSAASGANVFTAKLSCPFKISNLYFMLREESNAKNQATISSIVLSSPQGEIGEFTSLSNYYIGVQDVDNLLETFAIQLGQRKDRDAFLEMNGQNNPTRAVISFTSTVATVYTLYIVYEYYSTVIESEGRLLEDTPGELYRS